jgi:nucleotide sugar dehydrogenase
MTERANPGPVDVAVVGAGHVGLVSATCLAIAGHRVRVYDVDSLRVAQIIAGKVPFLEPGLGELLARARAAERISFHDRPDEALRASSVAFLCVNTPNRLEGGVDLSAVVDASRHVASHAPDGAVLVNRSTAPVGTAQFIRTIVWDQRGPAISVATNPEFLAEGTAIRDFLAPDRIVIGAWDAVSSSRVLDVYDPIVSRRLPPKIAALLDGALRPASGRIPVVVTDPPTAELTKYAANSFLAVKVSFINEIASIAEQLGADTQEVARAIGLDHRIGSSFLRPGIGWGGSCFPKDIVALQGMAEIRGIPARMLRAAHEVNTEQRQWVIRKLHAHLRTLVGRRIGLLGLSFKAGTDDVRNAPALEIASDLVKAGVEVRAFDPAVSTLPEEARGSVETVGDAISLARGADALVVVTEWPEFAALDLAQLREVMRVPLLLDGRNLLDRDAAEDAGLVYVAVGRPSDPWAAFAMEGNGSSRAMRVDTGAVAES